MSFKQNLITVLTIYKLSYLKILHIICVIEIILIHKHLTTAISFPETEPKWLVTMKNILYFVTFEVLMALAVKKTVFWDVTTNGLGERSWEEEMELAHSSLVLQPKYQTILCHIPENSSHHALFCMTEDHVLGQNNQLILRILNAHTVYFIQHLTLNFSSLTVQQEAWIAHQYSD